MEILSFFTIEPLYTFNYLIQMTITRLESPQDLAEFSIKNSLAYPRITTVRKTEKLWIIYADYYSRAFTGSFDLETGKCTLDQYLIRKK